MNYFRIGILLPLFFNVAYAADTDSPFGGLGETYLDRSQDIFFDQFATNNFSLQVLQIKNKFPTNSFVFGGSTQFDLQHWQGDQIEEAPLGSVYQQGNGLYFTQAIIDLMINISPWSTAFFSGEDNSIGRNDPNANYVYSPNAFLLLGNLDRLPFYSTIGVSSIPFGVFSGSGPWDQPLTDLYFNPTQAPQISIGYYQAGWNAAITGFNEQTNEKNDYAYSLSYTKNNQIWGYSLGVGYLTDIQTNDNDNTETHRHPTRIVQDINVGDLGAAWDINGSIHYQQWMLNGEYNISRNTLLGNTGKPQAYAFTTNYVKNIFGKDTTFSLGYSQAMHLQNYASILTGYDNLVSNFTGLKNAWSVNVSRPLSKSTVLGLDLQKAMTNPGVFSNSEARTYTATLDLVAYL